MAAAKTCLTLQALRSLNTIADALVLSRKCGDYVMALDLLQQHCWRVDFDEHAAAKARGVV
ncbi:hypothetical protein DF186_18355 [Enterococcus hirae]|nr:hypothetical protein DF186_18355 [Enterococcus hirae]